MAIESNHPQGNWSHYWHNFSDGQTPSSTILHHDFIDSLQPSDVVLDVGCGYGRITSLLAKSCEAVVGVDLNRKEVAHAALSNAASNIVYSIMSGTELGFQDEVFDKVTLLGVLGGVNRSTRDEMLDEAYRVLKPGGSVYTSEFAMKPNGRRYAHGLRVTGENGIMIAYNRRDGNKDVKFVGKHFYASELDGMLKDHGFNETKVRNPRAVLHSANPTTKGQRFVRKMVSVWGKKPL